MQRVRNAGRQGENCLGWPCRGWGLQACRDKESCLHYSRSECDSSCCGQYCRSQGLSWRIECWAVQGNVSRNHLAARKGSRQLGELGSPNTLVGQEPQTHGHNPGLGQKRLFCRQTRVKASHGCTPFEREALSSTDSRKFWVPLARSPKVSGLLG